MYSAYFARIDLVLHDVARLVHEAQDAVVVLEHGVVLVRRAASPGP